MPVRLTMNLTRGHHRNLSVGLRGEDLHEEGPLSPSPRMAHHHPSDGRRRQVSTPSHARRHPRRAHPTSPCRPLRHPDRWGHLRRRPLYESPNRSHPDIGPMSPQTMTHHPLVQCG